MGVATANSILVVAFAKDEASFTMATPSSRPSKGAGLVFARFS